MLFRFAANVPKSCSARVLLSHRVRFYAADTTLDLRTRLLEELKNSLKARDSLTSTAIRSVLSEVYAADKTTNGNKIGSSTIATFIRRACTRRLDSASQFNGASRPDLAEKEQQEADLLARFLPPLLPEAEIDGILKEVISEQAPLSQDGSHKRKSIGKLLKSFYVKVDRSSVDPDLVKRRAEALLAA
ncbi:Yqey-like protein-domain-containing protein [Russula brevipes]|nr:Yqey-like protein-domain-containing protein [Russula brevipes]